MNGRKLVEMNLTGTPLSATEAMNYGLVNHSVPREQLTPTLEKIIREIMHVSPISHSSFKRISKTHLPKTKLEMPYTELHRSSTSTDFRGGSSARVANRAPESESQHDSTSA